MLKKKKEVQNNLDVSKDEVRFGEVVERLENSK